MKYQANKFNELHNFLDQELKRNNLNKQEQTKTNIQSSAHKFGDFDLIQDKLKALQVRLQKMNNDNNQIKKYMPKQLNEEDEFLSDLKQIVKQRKNSIKKQSVRVQQQTPVKNKLNHQTKSQAVIKTVHQQSLKKSQSNFNQNNHSKSHVKKSSRCSTAKKIYRDTVTNANQSQNKKDFVPLAWSATRKNSCQKKMKPSVSYQQLRYLQRQLKDFSKQNISLKSRISELKGYQVQYWKMKDIFQKSEKLRKKQRLFKK